MDDATALMKAICEHPGEDVPRLMYADLLEERGQAVHAEFIRVQCRIATIDAHVDPVTEDGYDDPDGADCCLCDELTELRRREGELLQRNYGRFIPHDVGVEFVVSGVECLPKGRKPNVGCEFRRGFIDSLTLSAADWLRVHESVYWHPQQSSQSQWSAARVYREFVASAQPITKVVLTTRPTQGIDWPLDWIQRPSQQPGELSSCPSRWPTITFELSPSIEGHYHPVGAWDGVVLEGMEADRG